MKKSLSVIQLLVLTILFTCEKTYADTGMFAISPRVSTLGLGGELITRITQNINTRFGYYGAGFDFKEKESDIKYDFEADLSSVSAILDWHPFGNPFRVSGGVLINETDFNLEAKSADSLNIGGVSYSSADIGTLSGTLGFKGTAPYVGIGWGNAFDTDSKWGLLFDVGVAFTGAPDVSLSTNGLLATDPTFQANLLREQQDLEDELDEYKFYPVITLSLFFRF